jgi:hypothetical protein
LQIEWKPIPLKTEAIIRRSHKINKIGRINKNSPKSVHHSKGSLDNYQKLPPEKAPVPDSIPNTLKHIPSLAITSLNNIDIVKVKLKKIPFNIIFQ